MNLRTRLTMNLMHPVAFAMILVGNLAAQEAPPKAPADQLERAAGEVAWTLGRGSATTFGAALAGALGDAVLQVKGAAYVQSSALQSRLARIADRDVRDPGAGLERGWVLTQLAGYVRDYEVASKRQADDRTWVVVVRARVTGPAAGGSELAVELIDNGLSNWSLERFEEGGPGRAFDRRVGRFEGPRIAAYLRRGGGVKVVNPAKESTQTSKGQVAPAYRVVVDWQPVVVRSMVEKPNRARPTKGPRPEFISGGTVEVALRIEDLETRATLLDEKLSVPSGRSEPWSVDRLDAYVTDLVDVAKATVARTIFFALRPPVVLRKWVGDGGAWHAEVRMSRRAAAGFREFVLGNAGTLASPDWQRLAGATLVGGTAATCTFRLDDLVDAARVEVGFTEVRPVQ